MKLHFTRVWLTMISMVKAGASYNLKESKDELHSDNKLKCITLTSK